MAFIEKKNPIVMNIKLTSKGRELLSQGKLDFKYYGIGDSEIDYRFNAAINSVDSEYTAFDSSILRAVDKNPKLISFISRNLNGDPYNELTTVPVTAYQVENQVESLGFFTNNNTEFIIDSNHVKQPDCMIDMQHVNAGNVITLEKAPNYGTSGEEPAVGDLLFIRWTKLIPTTGYTVNKNNPTPNLFYRITEIIAGTLGSGSVTVRVDREIPDFMNTPGISGVFAGAMILYNEINYSGDTILNMSPTDYLDESVLSFLENSQCPTIVFPYWNMSIIYTEEVAGVQAENIKYTQIKSRKFGGFISYIQNQAPIIKKMGIIHYTNNSPANVYGEGLLLNTPVLDIPTIMWHNSSSATLGTKLYTIGGQKLLTGLDLYYYDLADPQGLIVGKVFPDLKIFVIEDQELLFAMSYKANRSWTLPDYNATTNAIIGVIPPSSGISVTWKYPDNSLNKIVIYDVSYCYKCENILSGWLTIPPASAVTVIGAYNTGYRINAAGGEFGGGLNICAYDYNNFNLIKTMSNGAAPGAPFTISISNINWGSDYCYDGNTP